MFLVRNVNADTPKVANSLSNGAEMCRRRSLRRLEDVGGLESPVCNDAVCGCMPSRTWFGRRVRDDVVVY
jgi:hypothetical protein